MEDWPVAVQLCLSILSTLPERELELILEGENKIDKFMVSKIVWAKLTADKEFLDCTEGLSLPSQVYFCTEDCISEFTIQESKFSLKVLVY